MGCHMPTAATEENPHLPGGDHQTDTFPATPLVGCWTIVQQHLAMYVAPTPADYSAKAQP